MRNTIKLIGGICLMAAASLTAYPQTSNAGLVSNVAAQQSHQSSPQVRQKTFEAVWTTIQKKYFDPNFGGLDWNKVRERYAPQVAAVKTDAELYELLNKMLGELRTSHLAVLPPEAIEELSEPPSTTGLGLRTVEGDVVIFRLLPGSSAERAGLRPGFVVKKIDDEQVEKLEDALEKLSGEPHTKVRVSYLDAQDAVGEVTLEREPLQLGQAEKDKYGDISLYAMFDAKRLADGIGYIRFTTFIEALNKKIRAAIESMHDAPGLIIDLRGNGGGDDSVAINMAGMLFDKKTLLMITKTRQGDDDYYQARPQKRAYLGPVVILVDEGSGSASEQFAAGMQESGRAVVIGKTTEGDDMDADLQKLPSGAYLVYAYGQPRTPKGVVIEGRGVIPNIEVSLSRAELLKGNDSQLNAAIQYIQEHKK
jgi:carboxyl-terminal processing protease